MADQGLRLEVLDKSTALITAAFGLVAALAWNSAVQGLFEAYYPPGTGLGPKFLYAGSVTALAVLVVIYVGRLAARARQALGDRPGPG